MTISHIAVSGYGTLFVELFVFLNYFLLIFDLIDKYI